MIANISDGKVNLMFVPILASKLTFHVVMLFQLLFSTRVRVVDRHMRECMISKQVLTLFLEKKETIGKQLRRKYETFLLA